MKSKDDTIKDYALEKEYEKEGSTLKKRKKSKSNLFVIKKLSEGIAA